MMCEHTVILYCSISKQPLLKYLDGYCLSPDLHCGQTTVQISTQKPVSKRERTEDMVDTHSISEAEISGSNAENCFSMCIY